MKKKALLVHHKHFSGINKSVYNQLVNNFHEYDIVTFNVDEALAKSSIFWLFLNLFFFGWEYGWDFFTGQKKLRSIKTFYNSTRLFTSKSRKYVSDHVKANNYVFVMQMQSLFDGSTEGVPHFVYSDHVTIANNTYPYCNPRQYIRSKAFIKVEKQLYQRATLSFVMSSNIQNLLIEKYNVPSNNVRCVYAGSNVPLVYNENTQKYRDQHILFVGLEWVRKGGPLLLEAFKNVSEVLPNASLTIVGCSPRVNVKNVTVIGKVPLESLPNYFNSASVFCMPTQLEPFGIVFVESMLYRLPIVSNNIGALPDMIENEYNGFLLRNNVADYAQVLIRLLNDPELCERLGENGYQRAKDRYTWDNVGLAFRCNILERLNSN